MTGVLAIATMTVIVPVVVSAVLTMGVIMIGVVTFITMIGVRVRAGCRVSHRAALQAPFSVNVLFYVAIVALLCGNSQHGRREGARDGRSTSPYGYGSSVVPHYEGASYCR